MKTIFLGLLVLWITAGCVQSPVIDRNAAVPEFTADEVVVYVRTGCPYCERALELIMDEGYIPDIRNVTESKAVFQELVTISHAYFPDKPMIVPVILLNNRVLRGFNQQSILELLNAQPISDPDNYAYCE